MSMSDLHIELQECYGLTDSEIQYLTAAEIEGLCEKLGGADMTTSWERRQAQFCLDSCRRHLRQIERDIAGGKYRASQMTDTLDTLAARLAALRSIVARINSTTGREK